MTNDEYWGYWLPARVNLKITSEEVGKALGLNFQHHFVMRKESLTDDQKQTLRLFSGPNGQFLYKIAVARKLP